MKIELNRFRVAASGGKPLSRRPTRIDRLYADDAGYQEMLPHYTALLRDQQQMLNASDQCAVLVIFQGMDTSGKDGAIAHVMSGINPQGCRVTSFKAPSDRELRHDFLWRAVKELPERGRIGIFNRSYYEDVLIARVHPGRLAGSVDAGFWRERYRSIVNFERHLAANSTRIVKIFLHISREVQRERLLDRIDNPKKNWKIHAEDIEERRFWPRYMKAYAQCLAATGTRHAPWFVVPADDKRNARIIISEILVHVFRSLSLRYPQTTGSRRRELAAMRSRLAAPGRASLLGRARSIGRSRIED